VNAVRRDAFLLFAAVGGIVIGSESAAAAQTPLGAPAPARPCPLVKAAALGPGQNQSGSIAGRFIAFADSPLSLDLVIEPAAAVSVDGSAASPASTTPSFPKLQPRAIHVVQLDNDPACTYFAAGFIGWGPHVSDSGQLYFQSSFGKLHIGVPTSLPGTLSITTDIGNDAWRIAASSTGTMDAAGLITQYGIDNVDLIGPNVKQGISTIRVPATLTGPSDICDSLKTVLAPPQDIRASLYGSASIIQFTGVTLDCKANTAEGDVNLAFSFFPRPIHAHMAFRAEGLSKLSIRDGVRTAPNPFSYDAILGSDVSLKVIEVDLPDGEIKFARLIGTVTFMKQTPQQQFVATISETGASMVGGPLVIPLSGDSAAAKLTLDSLDCSIASARTGGCSGKLSLALAHFSDLISMSYKNRVVSGNAKVSIAGDYAMTLEDIKLNLETSQLNGTATVSGPLLPSGKVTVQNFTIKLPNATNPKVDIVTGSVALNGSFTVADFLKIDRLTGDVGHDSEQNSQLVLSLDGSVSYGDVKADNKFPAFAAKFKSATLTIPFGSNRWAFNVPATNIDASGTLFGRRIVGGCPDAVTTSSSFITLKDDVYTFCVGLHLTPGSTTDDDVVNLAVGLSKPSGDQRLSVPPGTTLVSNAGLNPFASDKTGLAVRSVHIFFADGKPRSTRIGSRRLSISKLDLSYDPLNPNVEISEYAANSKLLCEEPLVGSVEFAIGSLVGTAPVATTTSDASVPMNMSADLGIGKDCAYADFDGSAHLSLGPDASFIVSAMHFGRGHFVRNQLKQAVNDDVYARSYNTYMKVNGSLYVKQAALVVKGVGFYTDPPGDAPGRIRVGGRVDAASTLAQNLPLLISNLFTALVGIFAHGK
jgi:hypothetical protein